MYIIADVPHILKNLKQAILNNGILTISDDIITKYDLPSNEIKLSHFKNLLHIQEKSDLLLTPRLKIGDFEYTNNCNKIRVNKATHVFSNDISSSLQLLTDEDNKPEFVTTVWFVKIIFQWFVLMTSRSCQVALNKKMETCILKKLVS